MGAGGGADEGGCEAPGQADEEEADDVAEDRGCGCVGWCGGSWGRERCGDGRGSEGIHRN